MQPSKSIVSEVDLIDVVRKLRGYINTLDNTHLLTLTLKQFDDPALTNMAERVAVDVDNVASSAANLLKHVESSTQYRAIIKRYTPNRTEE